MVIYKLWEKLKSRTKWDRAEVFHDDSLTICIYMHILGLAAKEIFPE